MYDNCFNVQWENSFRFTFYRKLNGNKFIKRCEVDLVWLMTVNTRVNEVDSTDNQEEISSV